MQPFQMPGVKLEGTVGTLESLALESYSHPLENIPKDQTTL